MPESITTTTTAQVLGTYYRQLTAEGVPADLVADIVRHAACQVHANDGIVVGEAATA